MDKDMILQEKEAEVGYYPWAQWLKCLVCMFECRHFCSTWQCFVFHSLDECRRWLPRCRPRCRSRETERVTVPMFKKNMVGARPTGQRALWCLWSENSGIGQWKKTLNLLLTTECHRIDRYSTEIMFLGKWHLSGRAFLGELKRETTRTSLRKHFRPPHNQYKHAEVAAQVAREIGKKTHQVILST